LYAKNLLYLLYFFYTQAIIINFKIVKRWFARFHYFNRNSKYLDLYFLLYIKINTDKLILIFIAWTKLEGFYILNLVDKNEFAENLLSDIYNRLNVFFFFIKINLLLQNSILQAIDTPIIFFNHHWQLASYTRLSTVAFK